jgi:ISXO2-like transposase domain
LVTQRTNTPRRDGDTVITTNTIESYLSVFKRSMRGTYQHCAEEHLHRYLAEFSFLTTALRLAWMTLHAPINWRKASWASDSPIDGLAAPTFKLQAKRFPRRKAKKRPRASKC